MIEKLRSKSIDFKIKNIKWETDGEEVDLPNELQLKLVLDPNDLDPNIESMIDNYLSDEFGWLHQGYEIELTECSDFAILKENERLQFDLIYLDSTVQNLIKLCIENGVNPKKSLDYEKSAYEELMRRVSHDEKEQQIMETMAKKAGPKMTAPLLNAMIEDVNRVMAQGHWYSDACEIVHLVKDYDTSTADMTWWDWFADQCFFDGPTQYPSIIFR